MILPGGMGRSHRRPLYVVRGGKITRHRGSEIHLPFVAGVYDQPIETTLRQLARTIRSLAKFAPIPGRASRRRVGAASPDDLDSPQSGSSAIVSSPCSFCQLSPAPDAKPNDIRLEKYVPVAAVGWRHTLRSWKVASYVRPRYYSE